MTPAVAHNDPSALEQAMLPWAQALQSHRLSYPEAHIIRFLASRGKAAGGARPRGIDVGFGSGHNLRALVEFGYETWGTELLREEVERLNAATRGQLNGGKLLFGPLESLPELQGRFDVALAWGVACLSRRSQMVGWLRSFAALLNTSGSLCLNFRTNDNWFYGLGAELEPGCFHLDGRAGPYANATFTFLDEPGVRSVLKDAGLIVENLQREDWWKKNLTERHSWWVVWAKKA